jgi:hypothetical protein
MITTSVFATVGSMLVGGAVAAVTIVSLVHAQTAAPGQSPTNVNQPVAVQYGG